MKQLGTVLGFLNYYRQYVPEFASLMAPLNKQKKQKKLNWDLECERNFRKVKECFRRAPLRAAPIYDVNCPFKLTTDFSGKAIAAILSQEQQGQERRLEQWVGE